MSAGELRLKELYSPAMLSRESVQAKQMNGEEALLPDYTGKIPWFCVVISLLAILMVLFMLELAHPCILDGHG